MKTDTNLALIMLGLVVVGVIALAVWGGAQVNAAAADVNASATASEVPGLALIGGQLAGWALSAVVGVFVTAVATGIVAFARQWWKTRGSKRAWRSGPNAQWQGQERTPKAISDADLMRLMMYQQMTAGQQGNAKQNVTPMPIDDDLNIKF